MRRRDPPRRARASSIYADFGLHLVDAALHSSLIHGLEVTSDHPLLEGLPTGAPTFGRVRLAKAGAWPDAEALTHEALLLTTHGRELRLRSDRPLEAGQGAGAWQLEVAGLVRFHWRSGAEDVHYESSEDCSPELLAFWFIHVLLPLYMAIEGLADFMHAGCVGFDDEALLLVAPTHGGKSTLVQGFVDRGHPLLADDKLPCRLADPGLLAVPSHPFMRPYRRNEDLGLLAPRFARTPRPVRALYLLQPAEADASVEIHALEGFRRFESLLGNHLFGFTAHRAQRLAYLARLSSEVSFFRLSVPWDLARLDEVHAAVIEHAASIGAASALP